MTAMGLLRLLTNPAVMSHAVLSRRQAWEVLDTVLSDDSLRVVRRTRRLHRQVPPLVGGR